MRAGACNNMLGHRAVIPSTWDSTIELKGVLDLRVLRRVILTEYDLKAQS